MDISRYMRERRSLPCWSEVKQRRKRLFSRTFRARTWTILAILLILQLISLSFFLQPLLVFISEKLIQSSLTDDWKRKSFYFYDYCGLREAIDSRWVSIRVCFSVLISREFLKSPHHHRSITIRVLCLSFAPAHTRASSSLLSSVLEPKQKHPTSTSSSSKGNGKNTTPIERMCNLLNGETNEQRRRSSVILRYFSHPENTIGEIIAFFRFFLLNQHQYKQSIRDHIKCHNFFIHLFGVNICFSVSSLLSSSPRDSDAEWLVGLALSLGCWLWPIVDSHVVLSSEFHSFHILWLTSGNRGSLVNDFFFSFSLFQETSDSSSWQWNRNRNDSLRANVVSSDNRCRCLTSSSSRTNHRSDQRESEHAAKTNKQKQRRRAADRREWEWKTQEKTR